jgi:RNA 2',3'-cyclic 3'-phosphodiesterase
MAADPVLGTGTSLRLFVAFDVPGEAQDAIDDAIEPLRERFPHARWTPRENRHVTLKFLGQTAPPLGEWVAEQISTVARATAPIETRTTAIGAFPGGRRARVLWAGLDDGRGRLAALAGALDRALERKFRPETRAFAPHCTVARSDPPLQIVGDDLDVALRPVEFTVDAIVVYSSHLQRPAPRYEPIAAFALTG